MFNVFHQVFTSFTTFALCVVFVAPCCFGEDQSKTITVVTVSEMCGGCVKKITKRFEDVKNVAKVECSIEKKTVTLFPKEGIRLSPKEVWEIMEGIAKTPTKLVSPEGTFTSKPKK